MGNYAQETRSRPAGAARLLTAAVLAVLALVAGCADTSPSTRTRGVTITVALGSPPPASMLKRFTAQTGIRVNWVQLDWDSLQTKISTAAMSKTFFADATDVDWSRVGQLDVTNWFYPLNAYLDTEKLKPDMPQLGSFTVEGKVIGVPYDTSFMVTTVNSRMFAKAGITTMPTTIAQYTKDLQQIKAKGVVKYPLNVPFAAAEGLSTYWYQTTEAFGGKILDKNFDPVFTDPESAGYRAMQWLVSAMKSKLVSPGNLNVTDSEGQQTLMAKGAAASTLGDYSGNVGTLYDVKASSSVTGQVRYIRTPGLHGPAGNVNNPDGIGIPRTSKYPKAAAKFVQWFIDPENQAAFAGLDGPSKSITGFPFPARLSALKKLNESGRIAQGGQVIKLLTDGSRPAFPGAQPPWYGQFSNAVYTNLHSAAAGQESVTDAISAIAGTVKRLKGEA